MIEIDRLLAAGTPAPSARWTGYPRYNFVGGNNDPELVPVEALAESAVRALRREGKRLATYNMGMGGLGHEGLRSFVAQKLSHQRGIRAGVDDVLITSGSLQGLDLVNQLLLEPGDVVIMEQLTYSGAIGRVKKLGVTPVGVPLDEEGIRLDLLDTKLGELKSQGKRVKYIYTIPTIQNPTGAVLGLERRKQLLEISQRHGVPIFEDECYADLLWEGDWPAALRGLPGGEEVIHIGSFSKSLAPALRLGYVNAAPSILGRLVSLKNDGGTGALDQMVVADYFGSRFDDHITRLKHGLKRKLDVLTATLAEQFGTSAEITPPKGGIFLWVRLPDQVDTGKLAGPALAEGIAFNPGPEWSTDADAARHHLRLCFALPTDEEIKAGVAALADVCYRETGVPLRSGNVSRS